MDVVSTFHFTSYDIIYARSAVETLCRGEWAVGSAVGCPFWKSSALKNRGYVRIMQGRTRGRRSFRYGFLDYPDVPCGFALTLQVLHAPWVLSRTADDIIIVFLKKLIYPCGKL